MTGLESVLARTRASGSMGPGGRPPGAERDELRVVAEEFESLFIKQMLDTMRSTINREHSLLDGGHAEEIFEDMLFEEYSLVMARSRSFGLADMIYDQMSTQVNGDAPDASQEAASRDPEQNTSASDAIRDLQNRSRVRAYDLQIPTLP